MFYNEIIECSASEFTELKKLLISKAYLPLDVWPSNSELDRFPNLYIASYANGGMRACTDKQTLKNYSAKTPISFCAYIVKRFPISLKTYVLPTKEKITFPPSPDIKLFFIPTPENRALLFMTFVHQGKHWSLEGRNSPKERVICVFNKCIYAFGPNADLNGFALTDVNAYIKKHLPQTRAKFYKNSIPLSLAWSVYQNNKALLDEIIAEGKASNEETPVKSRSPTGLTFTGKTGRPSIKKNQGLLALELFDPITGVLLPSFAKIFSQSTASLRASYEGLARISDNTYVVIHKRFEVKGKSYFIVSGTTPNNLYLRLCVAVKGSVHVKPLSILVADLQNLISSPVTFLYD